MEKEPFGSVSIFFLNVLDWLLFHFVSGLNMCMYNT